MEDKWLEVLARTILFEGIDKETLGTMIGCLQPKISRHAKNSYITNAGEPFSGLGILLEGKAAVIKETMTGNRLVMAILEPGDMFGEMTAFSSKKVWPASVHAKIDSTAMFIGIEKIVGSCAQVCGSHQAMIFNILRLISDRAIMLNRRIEYFSIKSLRGKISTYLIEHQKQRKQQVFDLPLNRNELAGFFNVSRESLSREMCRMRDEGLIDFYQSSVRIKDAEALREAAE